MSESHAFGQFLASLNTSHTDRRHADEFHLGALEALAGDERARAEALLLERMHSLPADLRVYSALGIVGSSASVEPLRRAIEQRSGLAQMRAAVALARIDSGYDPTPVLVAALRGGDFTVRSEAARGLGRSPLEPALPVLLDTLSDPNFGTRAVAFGALLEQLGLTRYRAFEHGRVKSIGARLLSKLRSVWGAAAEEMRAIAAALRSGRTAEELELDEPLTSKPEELEAVVSSFFGRRADERWRDRIDLDALTRLDDVGRRYIETVLLSELHNGDERIPAALAVLGGEPALAAMREALSSARGSMRVELARALERIGAEDDVARARAVLREAQAADGVG